MLLRIQTEFTQPPVRTGLIPRYFLTPPIGATLAVAFYLVVRGGFFANGTVADVNVSAFGGTGALVGLFADAAVVRLEGAFAGAFPLRRRKPPGSERPTCRLNSDREVQDNAGLAPVGIPYG